MQRIVIKALQETIGLFVDINPESLSFGAPLPPPPPFL